METARYFILLDHGSYHQLGNCPMLDSLHGDMDKLYRLGFTEVTVEEAEQRRALPAQCVQAAKDTTSIPI